MSGRVDSLDFTWLSPDIRTRDLHTQTVDKLWVTITKILMLNVCEGWFLTQQKLTDAWGGNICFWHKAGQLEVDIVMFFLKWSKSPESHMLSISAFPWRRSTEILYDRLLLRYFQLCWNQGLPEMSWDSLFKWDFLLSFFLFLKKKAKVKINDFLDGVYLSWTHLDISEVEPIYVNHKVPRKFWLNSEWSKNH